MPISMDHRQRVVHNTPEEDIDILRRNLNQEFLILTAFWIIFMQGGFAFLEAGSVRSKNTTSILFKNLLDMFLGALVYWGFGYAFAFGKPSNSFIGYNNFFSSNIPLKEAMYQVDTGSGQQQLNNENLKSAGKYLSTLVSGYGYATVSSTIVSGAMAERMRLSAYLICSTIITGFLYPVVVHWVWDESGWLYMTNGLSFVDSAGSGVVHVTGGMVALVGAWMIGPRLGRFPDDAEAGNRSTTQMRGHSIALTCLGGFMLFIGFLAFNAASQHHVVEPFDGIFISLNVTNTILSASSAAVSASIFNGIVQHWQKQKVHWSLLTLLNGCLSGLVAVCAGGNRMMNWAAVLTGVLAGISMVVWKILLLKYKIDDPVHTVPVHLGGGLTGCLTAPLWVTFGQQRDGKYIGGIFYGGGVDAFKGFGWNLLGTVCICLWSGISGFILFSILKKLNYLRVTEEQEKAGLDRIYHNEPAYPKSESLPIRKMINYDF